MFWRALNLSFCVPLRLEDSLGVLSDMVAEKPETNDWVAHYDEKRAALKETLALRCEENAQMRLLRKKLDSNDTMIAAIIDDDNEIVFDTQMPIQDVCPITKVQHHRRTDADKLNGVFVFWLRWTLLSQCATQHAVIVTLVRQSSRSSNNRHTCICRHAWRVPSPAVPSASTQAHSCLRRHC